jgi:hypothetical protein
LFLHPLCPYLKTKRGLADASSIPRSGGGPGRGGSAYPINAVRNPSGRLFKITSRDVWQVFLDHARDAPVPNLCCRYHLNGVCNDSCFFGSSHITLTGEQASVLGKWVESCRARMPRQPSDAAKKPKLVGNSDITYNDFPLAPFRTPTNEPVGWVLNTLLDRSAAARLHATTRGNPSPHSSQAPPAPTTVTTRSVGLTDSLNAHALARSQNPHPQAALSVTSPASWRIRTSPSSCCAGSHVTSPPTLAAATPTPDDTTPTPQTLPTPR